MLKLYMLLIGCLPKQRHVEQHDVFFGIGKNVKEVLQKAIEFWPEAGNSFHLDAWREVSLLDNFTITVSENKIPPQNQQLYFINLGGYKYGEFEEFHYKMLTVATDKLSAIKRSKQTAFFKHTGFKGAPSHIDEKYGVDVDDLFTVQDILSDNDKHQYSIVIEPASPAAVLDEIHLGYFRPAKVDDWG